METIGRQQVAVRSISIHNDIVLITYTQGGIGVLDLESSTVIPYELTSELSLFNSYYPINCIYFDNMNHLWIATNSGLFCVNEKNHETRHYTEVDGLPNSHIYGILPDENGDIWLSTNNGLSCYDISADNFSNYDISDGLQNNEFNTGAYHKSINGDLFFGGISGITYFDPNIISQNEINPEIIITGIRFANKYQQLTKNDIDNRHFDIPNSEEIFTIEFAGLSFINSYKNQYKYRISEISNDWIDLGNQHYISFNNLAHGEYTLELLASNNHGQWITEPSVYTINVIPKFYELNVFKWLMTFLLLVLIVIITRLRLLAITKQKNKLQALVNNQTSRLIETNKVLREEVLKHSETSNKLC